VLPAPAVVGFGVVVEGWVGLAGIGLGLGTGFGFGKQLGSPFKSLVGTDDTFRNNIWLPPIPIKRDTGKYFSY